MEIGIVKDFNNALTLWKTLSAWRVSRLVSLLIVQVVNSAFVSSLLSYGKYHLVSRRSRYGDVTFAGTHHRILFKLQLQRWRTRGIELTVLTAEDRLLSVSTCSPFEAGTVTDCV